MLSERSNSRPLICRICRLQKRTLTQNAAAAARSQARCSPCRARDGADWLRSHGPSLHSWRRLCTGGPRAYLMSTSRDEERKECSLRKAPVWLPRPRSKPSRQTSGPAGGRETVFLIRLIFIVSLKMNFIKADELGASHSYSGGETTGTSDHHLRLQNPNLNPNFSKITHMPECTKTLPCDWLISY